DRLHGVEILGTDIDPRSLATAAQPEFREVDFSEAPRELRARYFGSAPPFAPIDRVRRLVRFRRDDLFHGEPPQKNNALIVCRNVIIYFERRAQERLLRMFYEALSPEGFLVLGKVESLVGEARAWFTPVAPRQRVFRRAG